MKCHLAVPSLTQENTQFVFKKLKKKKNSMVKYRMVSISLSLVPEKIIEQILLKAISGHREGD